MTGLKSTILVLILVAAAMAATPGNAQVANYLASGNANGTWNLTQNAAATTQQWQNVVEDSRWVVSAWVSFAGTTASYFYSTLDKQTGVSTAPTQIGGTGTTNVAPTVESARAYRPGICWTYDAVQSNNGVAIAVCNDTPAGLNVVVHFLRIDPASVATQPVWQVHPLRQAVDVSQSSGESQSPAIACIDAGDIFVAWRDLSATGTIGEVGGLNPIAQTPNPSALVVSDLYVRRYAQSFPAGPAAAPGMVDVAAPGATTINLTDSTSADWHCEMRAGASDGVYIAWASEGSESDDVCALGANSGPKGGIPGAETVEVYIALVRTSGATSLQRFSAFNVSESSGPDNFTFFPSLGFNRALSQLVVVWQDLTMTGGIGGVATLAATDTGIPPVPNEYDVFARSFSIGLAPQATIKVTATTTREAQTAVTGIDSGGWVIAWTEIITATDIRSRQTAYDGNLQAKGGIQQYPVQSLVVGGSPPAQFLWALTSHSTTGITVAFGTGGTPDNLRTGQPGAVTGVSDQFLAVGTVTASGGTSGILQIQSFIVNSGNVVQTANLPNTVNAVVTFRNVSPTDSVQLNTVTLTPPQGWTLSGSALAMPIIVPPGVTDTRTLAYSPVPASLLPGPNRFSVSAAGTVGANTVTAASNFDLPVSGQTGDLAGIQVSCTINPSTISNGIARQLVLTVTITNAGSDPVSDLSFSGLLPTGITPANLSALTWSPALAGQLVTSGNTRTFEATLNAAANIAAGAYQPGLTLTCDQGIRTGTITIGPANALTVLQGTGGGGGGGGGGLVNSTGGGCALAANGSFGWALLALLGALASAATLRTLRRRTSRA